MNNKDTLVTGKFKGLLAASQELETKANHILSYAGGSEARNDEFRFGYIVSHFQNNPSKDME